MPSTRRTSPRVAVRATTLGLALAACGAPDAPLDVPAPVPAASPTTTSPPADAPDDDAGPPAEPAPHSPAPTAAPAPTGDAQPSAPAPGPATPPAADLAPADLVVSYVAWDPATRAVTAAGYVDGLLEGDGTCTLRLSRDGAVVEGRISAVADATTTVCPALEISSASLVPGTWDTQLLYSSATSAGTSPVTQVVIP